MLKVKKKKRNRRELSFTQSVDAAMFFAYSVKQKQEKGVFLFCNARRGELKKAMRFSFFFFCSCIKRSIEHTNTHMHLCFLFSSPPFFSRLLLFEILWKKKKRIITLYFSVCRYIFYVYTTQQLRLARQTNSSRFKKKKKEKKGKKDIIVKSQETHSRNTTGKCTDRFLIADFSAFSFKELLTVPRKTTFHSQKKLFFFYIQRRFFSRSVPQVCLCVFFFFSRGWRASESPQ